MHLLVMPQRPLSLAPQHAVHERRYHPQRGAVRRSILPVCDAAVHITPLIVLRQQLVRSKRLLLEVQVWVQANVRIWWRAGMMQARE